MHFDIHNPTGLIKKADGGEDGTYGASGETTKQSDTIPFESGGANATDVGDGGNGGSGISREQADTGNDATGLGDAKTNAITQGGTDGTSDTASQSGDQESTKPKGK